MKKQDIYKSGSVKKITELDLTIDEQRRPTSCVEEFKINFRKRRCIFGKRSPKGILPLKIVSSCIPEDKIQLNPGCDLLTLDCMGNKGSNIKLQIDGESFVPLSVIFNPGAIKDCGNREINKFDIDYTIECSMEDGVKKETGSVTINLRPIAVEPELLPSSFTFEYQAAPVEAKLQIHNSSDLNYAPTASMKIINAELRDKNGKEIISDAVEVLLTKAKESRPYTQGSISYRFIGDQPPIVNCNNNEIGFIYPGSGYWIEVPLSIDLSKIPNPQQEQDYYRIYLEYEYWDDIRNSRKCTMQKFFKLVIKKNHERIELGVNLQEKAPSVEGYLNIAVVSKPTRVEYPIFVNGQGTSNYRIAIQNTATIVQNEHKNAGIVIKNLTSNGIAFSKGITARTKQDGDISLSSFCSCPPVNSPQERLLPNDIKAILVSFNLGQTQIDHFWDAQNKKKIFSAEAEVKVSFDYYIDETGDLPKNASFQHFEGSVIFTLEIEPRREWLGVDFGTSAVVALYGSAIHNLGDQENENYIKNLKDIKTKGLQKAYKTPQPVTDEDIFINSKIVLGDKFPDGQKTVQTFEDYPKGKILFSPGDVFTYSKLLPSLKSMMGYDTIPLQMSGITELAVDSIYEMAYRQLFNLYLKGVSQGRPIEKIVMTYPNTFADKHVNRLKELAKECLPTLRDEYIVTVSESDAVAYRYLMCRDEFMRYAGGDVDRNILIYDMGAGTLDITYLSNILEDGKHKVEIKGKFGISKAGNYLDYVLAEIVVDLCNRLNLKDLNDQPFDGYLSWESSRTVDIDTCSKLKDYVKDVLKPLLANIDDINNINSKLMMPNWGNIAALESIQLSEVFRNKKFKEFINEISVKVIEGCDKIFPSTLKDIDVVVFSGRMTTMKAIRKAVIDAIEKTTTKKVIAFDIARSENRQNDSLRTRKTAVVEGALNYVENFIHGGQFELRPPRPFFAHYCVIVQRANNKLEVIDLVDNSMVDSNYVSSTQLYFTGNKMSRVSSLYLIQTYAVGDQAILDDFTGDRNLSTLLVHQKTENIEGARNVHVQVHCPTQGNRFDQGTKPVSLWIGNIEQDALPHENITSKAFRKSAWPIVF